MARSSSSAPRPIELLAPAKDLETARAALHHGADAIYIGAPRFGARSAAGVPISDLRLLTTEAHRYGVRIYVTLNTILYDHELADAERLIWQIYDAGADAVIVQDMGVTKMNLPPIPLHASTQCDTTDPEDVRLLDALGFEQIVLARELNLEQIRRACAVTERPIEVFVHGALCVSYSGRCYLSSALTKRSANRGECSQQCRLPYDLEDAEGKTIRTSEHLLSPRDLNRSAMLEALLEAGVSSLKIEGRLKGMSYVKNITAYYRQCLDQIIAKYPDRYCRASYGTSRVAFTPDPSKSFNRGFTEYAFYLPSPERPMESIINVHSPKSQGKYLGILTFGGKRQWRIQTDEPLANGDGLFYRTPSGEVGGIQVNKVLPDNSVELARPLALPKGSQIWRNYDHQFERLLSAPTAMRKLSVSLTLGLSPEGLQLTIAHTQLPVSVSRALELVLEPAQRFDPERLEAELCKLGDTPLEATSVRLELGTCPPFVPVSLLGQLRRGTVVDFVMALEAYHQPDRSERTTHMPSVDRRQLPQRTNLTPDYRANIANELARRHYQELGYQEADLSAFELAPTPDAALMTTKHCIRHELGFCSRETSQRLPYAEPLYLVQSGERLRLEFDCQRCQMLLYRTS